MKKLISIFGFLLFFAYNIIFAQQNWSLTIHSSIDILTPSQIELGTQTDGTEGYDPQYDLPIPPDPPGELIKIYFPHTGSNWPEFLGNQYRSDYKGTIDPTWEFRIESTIDGTVSLSWDSGYVNNLDNNIQLFLHDLSASKIIDLRKKGSYTFTYSEKRDFKILGAIKVDLKFMMEGFWNGTNQIPDTLKTYLAQSTSPYNFVDTTRVTLNNNGTGLLIFPKVASGNYYLVLTHRNHIEVWSAAPQVLTRATTSFSNYNFSTAATKAYGTNSLKLIGTVYVAYGGDVNQDGIVDIFDLIAVDNDNSICRTGYTATDTNGDSVVDIFDLIITDNNNANAITKQRP
jgi:hypothetical protein